MRCHPLAATRLEQLGAAYLARRRLNEALWPYGAATDSDPLARALRLLAGGAARNQAQALLTAQAPADPLPGAAAGWAGGASAEAIEAALDAALAGLPWDPAADPDTLLPGPLRFTRDWLAWLRHAPGPWVPLAAPLRPRPQAPRRGHGAIEVLLPGDPQASLAGSFLQRLTPALARRPATSLVWMHAPLPHHRGGRRACEAIETLAAGGDAQACWQAIDRLHQHHRLVAAGEIERVLEGEPACTTTRSQTADAAAAVDGDRVTLACSGIPRVTPCAVLGQRLYVGLDSLGPLLAALDEPCTADGTGDTPWT